LPAEIAKVELLPETIGLGENVALIPFGRLEALSFTDDVEPLTGFPTFTATKVLELRLTARESDVGMVNAALIVTVTATECATPFASAPFMTML
jgi:hypothetical protein